MPDGDDHWTAITALRDGHTRHERELGGLSSKTADLAQDVNELGEETRKTRHDLRSAISASEGRLSAEFRQGLAELDKKSRERTAATDQRLTDLVSRWRQLVVVAAPAVMTAIGWLIGRG